jgi:hypothetical protein
MLNGRTQRVPSAESGTVRDAVYNLPIHPPINLRTPGMLSPRSSRFFSSLLFALLFVVEVNAQNRAGAEGLLAGKIASATGPKTMALEVLNRSSLSSALSDDIRRNLLTQLAVTGVRFVTAEQAAVNVRVTLSEDLRSYVWVAEIRQGANAQSVVMVSLPRSAVLAVEPAAAAVMELREVSLWSQTERILDVAVIEGAPARMLVLDANSVTLYRMQEGRWLVEQALPITHSRPWPRDLRGRLVWRTDGDNNHLFDAWLPGVYCRGSRGASLAMTCFESNDPWPIGADLFSQSSSFTSSRNFFSGTLSPGTGTRAPAFYSAAAVPREPSTWWLLAAVDGKVHLLDGVTDQVIEKLKWGSDIASLRSGCGSGWQVLATGAGAGRNDAVQAFESTGREPVAASPPLDVGGAVTALWTGSGGTSVVAVVHNSETGEYEAFRLTLTCGR